MFSDQDTIQVLNLSQRGKKEAVANGERHFNLRLKKIDHSTIRFLLPDGVNVDIHHRGHSDKDWKNEVAMMFDIKIENALISLKFKVERCHPSQETSRHGEVFIKYRLSW